MGQFCVPSSIRGKQQMFTNKKRISVLGVASDLGANMAGTRLGPDAIRIAGLHRVLKGLNYDIEDLGNLTVPLRSFGTDGVTNYLKEITDLNKSIYESCSSSLQKGNIPLTLGGDHSIAIGTVAASANHYKNLGLIWIDTHADLNNPNSSLTKNIHGMPVSTLLHQGYPSLVALVKRQLLPENIAIIGLRDIDKEERIILSQSKINYYTMREVDERGIQGVFKDVKSKLIDKLDHVHISFDLDVMDPTQVPGVSTPVDGGLTIREAHLLLELLFETQKMVSCDFVELNPMSDLQGKSAQTAVNLIGSIFGTSII